MTSQEIEQLRALCDAATPGPWEVAHAGHGMGSRLVVDEYFVRRLGGDVAIASDIVDPEPEGGKISEANAAFIAAARTALPALLDEVERLEALFQQTHGVHHSWVAQAEKLRAENASLKEQMTKLVLATDCARRTDGDEP